MVKENKPARPVSGNVLSSHDIANNYVILLHHLLPPPTNHIIDTTPLSQLLSSFQISYLRFVSLEYNW